MASAQDMLNATVQAAFNNYQTVQSDLQAKGATSAYTQADLDAALTKLISAQQLAGTTGDNAAKAQAATSNANTSQQKLLDNYYNNQQLLQLKDQAAQLAQQKLDKSNQIAQSTLDETGKRDALTALNNEFANQTALLGHQVSLATAQMQRDSALATDSADLTKTLAPSWEQPGDNAEMNKGLASLATAGSPGHQAYVPQLQGGINGQQLDTMLQGIAASLAHVSPTAAAIQRAALNTTTGAPDATTTPAPGANTGADTGTWTKDANGQWVSSAGVNPAQYANMPGASAPAASAPAGPTVQATPQGPRPGPGAVAPGPATVQAQPPAPTSQPTQQYGSDGMTDTAPHDALPPTTSVPLAAGATPQDMQFSLQALQGGQPGGPGSASANNALGQYLIDNAGAPGGPAGALAGQAASGLGSLFNRAYKGSGVPALQQAGVGQFDLSGMGGQRNPNAGPSYTLGDLMAQGFLNNFAPDPHGVQP